MTMAPSLDIAMQVEAPDKEALVSRNPHRDFAAVEASRIGFGDLYRNHASSESGLKRGDEKSVNGVNGELKVLEDGMGEERTERETGGKEVGVGDDGKEKEAELRSRLVMTKTPWIDWRPGMGGREKGGFKMHCIDPADPSREVMQNYKLMISTTVPRPIALVSTISSDGQTKNLAPFSYWQCVCTDPPLYSLSFVGATPSDTLTNILSTKQLCISTISPSFISAANYTSINTPPQISEWTLSGLTTSASTMISPPFVAESKFSIEAVLHSHQEILDSKGEMSAVLCLVKAVMWHVDEEVLIEKGEKGERVDLAGLDVVWRGGGITYGTLERAFELPRPEAFRVAREREEVRRLID